MLEAAGGFNLVSAPAQYANHPGKQLLLLALIRPAICWLPGENHFLMRKAGILIEEISSLVIPNRNINYVNDDLADRSGVVNRSIITRDDITVLDNLTVDISAPIKASGSATARWFTATCLQRGYLLGQELPCLRFSIHAGRLFVESGVSIGQPGKIKSVV